MGCSVSQKSKMGKSPCGQSQKVFFWFWYLCKLCVVGVVAGLRLSMPSVKGGGYWSGVDDVLDHVTMTCKTT
jgi:hypothetical protein